MARFIYRRIVRFDFRIYCGSQAFTTSLEEPAPEREATSGDWVCPETTVTSDATPRSVFGSTYNWSSKYATVRWMYYTSSSLSTPIDNLNKIYWRRPGDTDTSKWGGVNSNNLKVNTWYNVPSSWSYRELSHTFPASKDKVLTAIVPETTWNTCYGTYKESGIINKAVTITFPPDDIFHEAISGYEGKTLKNWKCASKSKAYGGNSYTPGKAYTFSELRAGEYFFYPEFETDTYTISLNGNGGTLSKTSFTVKYGSKCSELANVSGTRTGYTLSGWNTKSDGTGTSYSSSTTYSVAGNTTLYAQWTKNKYTVTAYPNGGTFSSTTGWTRNSDGTCTKTVEYNNQIGTLPNGSRAYHSTTFKYKKDSTSGTDITSSYHVTGTLKIYAIWTRSQYKVVANVNNGTWGTIPSGWTKEGTTYYKVIGVNDTIGTLPTATRTNYVYKGWRTGTGGGDVITSSSKASGTNDIFNIYAYWTTGTTIYFDCGTQGTKGGERYFTRDVVFGTSNNFVHNSPVCKGNPGNYLFEGWFDANGNQAYEWSLYNNNGTVIEAAIAVPGVYWNSSSQWNYSGSESEIYLYARWRKCNCWTYYNNGWRMIRDIKVYKSGWKPVEKWFGYNTNWKNMST